MPNRTACVIHPTSMRDGKGRVNSVVFIDDAQGSRQSRQRSLAGIDDRAPSRIFIRCRSNPEQTQALVYAGYGVTAASEFETCGIAEPVRTHFWPDEAIARVILDVDVESIDDAHAQLTITVSRRGTLPVSRRRVMSWDIFVRDIPPTAQSVDDIPDDFVPRPLGSRAEIIHLIGEVVPGVDFSDPSWGTFEGPDFSVEFNIGAAGVVDCLALHVRGGDAAAGLVADLLLRCGWRAFDPSSESGIFDPGTAVQSLQRWRAYRDHVVRSDNAG